MVIEKSTNDGIILKDSGGDILHVIKAREVFIGVHPRDANALVVGSTPTNQDENEGIAIYYNQVTSVDGAAFSGTRSDLMVLLDELFPSGGSTGAMGVQGGVATVPDLPAAADKTGKYYLVNEGSGGLVVFGNRIGGNDPGYYYSDGSVWIGPKRDIDAGDVFVNPGSYTIISAATTVKAALIELEAEISTKSSYNSATLSETTATIIYKGGLDNSGEWFVNNFDRNNNMARTTATVSNNSSQTTLANAWSNRATLNYS